MLLSHPRIGYPGSPMKGCCRAEHLRSSPGLCAVYFVRNTGRAAVPLEPNCFIRRYETLTSALGQKRTFRTAIAMSALSLKADVRRCQRNVREGHIQT